MPSRVRGNGSGVVPSLESAHFSSTKCGTAGKRLNHLAPGVSLLEVLLTPDSQAGRIPMSYCGQVLGTIPAPYHAIVSEVLSKY